MANADKAENTRNNKTAQPDADCAAKRKLVAGAGFEPATFGL